MFFFETQRNPKPDPGAARAGRPGRYLARQLIALLAPALLAGAALAAQDHIVERSWFEDASGKMNLSEARQQPTTPFSGALSRGYGTAPVWIRLRIDPTAPPDARETPAHLALRIRPSYLDDIQVFDPLTPGGVAGVVGDHHHPRQDVLPGADFRLPIARGEAPHDIWLRLQSTSVRQIDVAVLEFSDLESTALRQNVLFGLYIGLLLMQAAWGLVSWLLRRETMMASFAGMELTAALFALSSMGFLRVFWPQAWSAASLDLLGSAFSILGVGGAILFHVHFLAEIRPARWAMFLLKGMLALAPVNLALLAGDQTMLALRINMWMIVLAPIACMICALTGRVWANAAADGHAASPALPRKAVLAFYALILGLLLLASTTALALLPASAWTIYISQLHGLVTGLLALLMLQYRAYVMNRQHQQTVLALERADLMTRHERDAREDQEKLLAMLAHEIKTPLATMHLRLDAQANGSREIKQAMHDMNGVIDRCLQAARLGDGQLEAQMELHDLEKIARDAMAACSHPERVRLDLPAPVHVLTDGQLLFIVLNNLLENACKYSAPGTPIKLDVRCADDPALGRVLRLELRNRLGNAGWPDAGRLFQKYYRSPHARRQAGTGLGLYLVRSLAATLGGRIDYAPDLPQDTQDEGWICFVLRLPAGDAA